MVVSPSPCHPGGGVLCKAEKVAFHKTAKEAVSRGPCSPRLLRRCPVPSHPPPLPPKMPLGPFISTRVCERWPSATEQNHVQSAELVPPDDGRVLPRSHRKGSGSQHISYCLELGTTFKEHMSHLFQGPRGSSTSSLESKFDFWK